MGRLMNCDTVSPNCVAKLIDNKECLRIVIFALQNIKSHTELVWDNGDRSKEGIEKFSWLKS